MTTLTRLSELSLLEEELGSAERAARTDESPMNVSISNINVRTGGGFSLEDKIPIPTRSDYLPRRRRRRRRHGLFAMLREKPKTDILSG